MSEENTKYNNIVGIINTVVCIILPFSTIFYNIKNWKLINKNSIKDFIIIMIGDFIGSSLALWYVYISEADITNIFLKFATFCACGTIFRMISFALWFCAL